MNSTVSFLLEGLRGRDCQGISLDNPLDTTMMVLSGVGSHYKGHGLKIPILSFWLNSASSIHYSEGTPSS
jgi:hypothetical protein